MLLSAEAHLPGVDALAPGVPPNSPKPQRPRRRKRKERSVTSADTSVLYANTPTLYTSACETGTRHLGVIQALRGDDRFRAPLCVPDSEVEQLPKIATHRHRMLILASHEEPEMGQQLKDAAKGMLRNRYTPQQIRKAQERDPDIAVLLDLVKNKDLTEEQVKAKLKETPKAVSRFWKKKHQRLYFAQHDVLVKSTKPAEGPPLLVYSPAIILPYEYRMIVLQFVHDRLGHHGHDKTLSTLRERFDWPSMHSDVIRYINTCDVCQRSKNPMGRVKHLLRNIVTGMPNECVQIDHLKLPHTKRGHIGLLVMIDHFSKFMEAAPCRDMTAEEAARLLDQCWFHKWGTPAFIQSDNGSQFTSKLFEEFLAMMEVAHVLTAPYHPRSNGLVERANRTIIATLRLQCSTKQNTWDDFIQKAVFAHNCTVQATTKVTPNALFTGGNKTLPLGSVFPSFSPEFRGSPHEMVREHQRAMQHFLAIARANTKQQQIRQKRIYDARLRKAFTYKPGDVIITFVPVISRDNSKKLTRMWRGPFTVRSVSENGMSIYTDDGRMYNYENCRPYFLRPHDFVVGADDKIEMRPWKPDELEDVILPDEIDPKECKTDSASRDSVMDVPLPPPSPMRMRLRDRDAKPRPKYAESSLTDVCARICNIAQGPPHLVALDGLPLDDDLAYYETADETEGGLDQLADPVEFQRESEETSSNAQTALSSEPDLTTHAFVRTVPETVEVQVIYVHQPERITDDDAFADEVYEFVLQTLVDVPTAADIPAGDIFAFKLPSKRTPEPDTPLLDSSIARVQYVDTPGKPAAEQEQRTETTTSTDRNDWNIAAATELQKEQSTAAHDRRPIVPVDDPLNKPRMLAEPVCIARNQFFLTQEWLERKARMIRVAQQTEWPSKAVKVIARETGALFRTGDFLQSPVAGVVTVPANFDMRTCVRRELKKLLKPDAVEYLFRHRRGEGKATLLPAGFTDLQHEHSASKRWYFLLVKTRHEDDASMRRICDTIADLAYLVDTHKETKLSVLMLKEAWEWKPPLAIAHLFKIAFEETGVELQYFSRFAD